MSIVFSVFTKPWKMPIPELGAFVNRLGFDGIELPVRPGFQVEPERICQDLPVAIRQLAERDVRVTSISGSADERMIAACAEAGVPLIRVMVQIVSSCACRHNAVPTATPGCAQVTVC